MKLIRTQSGLQVDGTNERMKLLLAKIKETEDRKTLRLLSRAWWAEWLSANRKAA